MNENHALCSTPEWASHLHEDALPASSMDGISALETVGYERITVSTEHGMTFVAHKPSADIARRR
jgi:hypothetical protein